MLQKDMWANYYKAKENNPPSKLLVDAIQYVKVKNKVLELGAGGLVDAKFLLEQGFDVVAIDSSPASAKLAEEIKNEHFSFIQSEYFYYDFKSDFFDLVSAQLALPFSAQETFFQLFENIKKSLKPEGVFTGHFFGINDEWNDGKSKMTFHTKEQVENLLQGLTVIKLVEKESDKKTALGKLKHWHQFFVIAKKGHD